MLLLIMAYNYYLMHINLFFFYLKSAGEHTWTAIITQVTIKDEA